MKRLDGFATQLRALGNSGRKRALLHSDTLNNALDFSSNDYLGLAQSSILRDAAKSALDSGIAHGSGGSRLLGGNRSEHEILEEFAAEFYSAQSALFFSTGYAANTAFFSTVPQRGDLVLYDALIHASTHEGMRLGRATCESFTHNNLNMLEDAIIAFRKTQASANIWIAVESLYSMDGDQAPLAQIIAIAERYECILVIDEAHAVGVYGEKGEGLSGIYSGRDDIITLRTCGKALGVEGALLTLPSILRDFMINRARPFIFSTAPSPLTAYLVRHSIQHIADHPNIRAQLHTYIDHAKRLFSNQNLPSGQDSQIIPIIIGDDNKVMDMAAALRDQNFDIRGIRPPTVPDGTSRLRISLTLNISQDNITTLAQAINAF